MNRLSLMFAHLVAWGQRGEKLCHQAFLVEPDRKFMAWTDVAFSRLTVPNGPWTQQKCSSGEFELLHCRVVEKRRYILRQMLTCSLIKYFICCLNSPLLFSPPSLMTYKRLKQRWNILTLVQCPVYVIACTKSCNTHTKMHHSSLVICAYPYPWNHIPGTHSAMQMSLCRNILCLFNQDTRSDKVRGVLL